MNWELIFKIAYIGVLPFWALLAFGPRSEAVMRVILFCGAGLLAATYSVLIIGLLSGVLDAGGPDTGGSPDLTTLAGVMALFDSEGGATIGWIHYLAFDLFVGIWVARNADQHGYQRVVQIIILFLC